MTRIVRLIIVAAVLAGAALVAVGWLRAGGLAAVAWQESSLWNTGELAGPGKVGQVFVSPADSLARIEVRAGTYGAWPTDPFLFELIELPSLPKGDRARLSPSDGTPLKLKPGGRLTQLVDIARPDYQGIELLVSRPAGLISGRLVFRVYSYRPQTGRRGETAFVRSKAAGELPAYGFTRFDLPAFADLPSRTLWLEFTLEDANPGGALIFYWNEHLPLSSLVKVRRATAARSHLDDSGRSLRGDLVLRLAYPPGLPVGQIRAAVTGSAWAASDNAFLPISFKRLDNSAGKAYLFYLSGPKARHGRTITLWAGPEADRQSHLVRDGVAVDGSLAFRAYAAVAKGEAVGRFVRRLKAGGAVPAAGAWLIIPAAFLPVLGLLLLIRCALRPGAGRPDLPPDRASKSRS